MQQEKKNEISKSPNMDNEKDKERKNEKTNDKKEEKTTQKNAIKQSVSKENKNKEISQSKSNGMQIGNVDKTYTSKNKSANVNIGSAQSQSIGQSL